MNRKNALAIVLMLLLGNAYAADTPVSFDSKDQRVRYDQLLEELRCLVCQNQSLADSHAELAQDLRDEVYTMVRAGKDNDAITSFMVERYGDFVLYKPPVKMTTWLLWFGPVLLLGSAVLVVFLTTRTRDSTEPPLSDSDRARAQDLLKRSSPDEQ